MGNSPWVSFSQKSQPDPLVDGFDKVRAIIREQAETQIRPAVRKCRACEKKFEPRRYDHVFCCGRCRDIFRRVLHKMEGKCTDCGKEPEDGYTRCRNCRTTNNRQRAEKRKADNAAVQERHRRAGNNTRLAKTRQDKRLAEKLEAVSRRV